MTDDIFEASLWYNADLPGERSSAQEGIERVFVETAYRQGVRFAAIKWEELEPSSPRLKEPPPAYMRGQPRVLLGWAPVVGKLLELPASRFIDDLSDEDLSNMRRRTRQQILRAGGPVISDEICDDLINQHGPPAAAEETLH